jgi:hypothetical protein
MKDALATLGYIIVFLFIYLLFKYATPTIHTDVVNGNKNIAVQCTITTQCMTRIEKYCGINNFTITNELSWPYNIEAVCKRNK